MLLGCKVSVSSNPKKKIGDVSYTGFGEGGLNPGGFITYVCLKTSWIENVASPFCSTTSLPRIAENPALKSPNLDISTEGVSSENSCDRKFGVMVL